MTSLAADEGGAEGGESAGPNKRPKEGTVGAEVLDTERLAWCTRILNQVSSGTRIPPCAWCTRILNQVRSGTRIPPCAWCTRILNQVGSATSRLGGEHHPQWGGRTLQWLRQLRNLH